MEDKKNSYIEFKNDKKYLNIEKLKNEGNYPWVGMFFIETPEEKEFSKQTGQFNAINYFSDSNFKRGNVLRACDLAIEGIKLSLELYNEVLTNDSVHKDKSR